MTWTLALTLTLCSVFTLLAGFVVALYIHDRWFSKDNILRNFPVFGRFRYHLIEMGPKLRQYIVADSRKRVGAGRCARPRAVGGDDFAQRFSHMELDMSDFLITPRRHVPHGLIKPLRIPPGLRVQ